MKRSLDVSTLTWTLTGWLPGVWRDPAALPDVAPLPARLPGSAAQALLDAKRIPDWNLGHQSRHIEWLEHRDWVYEAVLPEDVTAPGERVRLRGEGLDGPGLVLLGDAVVGAFDGAYASHEFDLSAGLALGDRRLRLVFEAHAGTSPRLDDPRGGRVAQLGAWDRVRVVATDGEEIREMRVWTSIESRMETGNLYVRGRLAGERARRVRCVLTQRENVIHEERFSAEEFLAGVSFRDIPVRVWQVAGHGEQPLYRLTVEVLDEAGAVLDTAGGRVGFKHVAWEPVAGAPEEADPWLCVVNGRPLGLQGVTWTPLRPYLAEVDPQLYRDRLSSYRDLGVNVVRLGPEAGIERGCFYDACDELGLLVWQELPVGDTPEAAAALVSRLEHHVSILAWATDAEDGEAICDAVDLLDPTRRCVPRAALMPLLAPDAPVGASGMDLIEAYAGGLNPMPIDAANPLWARTGRRPEVEAYTAQQGRSPELLRSYTEWSQARQAEAIAGLARDAKLKFPAVGGLILRAGHDGFPWPASPAVVDYWGRPKAATLLLKAVWGS